MIKQFIDHLSFIMIEFYLHNYYAKRCIYICMYVQLSCNLIYYLKNVDAYLLTSSRITSKFMIDH